MQATRCDQLDLRSELPPIEPLLRCQVAHQVLLRLCPKGIAAAMHMLRTAYAHANAV